MIMRTMNYCLAAILAGASACAQMPTNLPVPPRPPWSVVVKVADEFSQPVAGASVEVSYYVKPPPGRSVASENIEGLTDTNGTFTASHADTGSAGLGFRVTKPGYYLTNPHGQELYEPGQFDERTVAASRNPKLTFVLKKVGQPIPMYAKRVETKVQRENEPVGFDLAVGDWVSPFGAGKTTDLFFTVQRKIVSDRQYDAEVRLAFPNKGDGIAVAPTEPDTGSALRTPRTAAESGYEPERTWHYSNSAQPEPVFAYFLRVRTSLDATGNVKSALYAKVRGDIRFYVGTRAPRAGMGFDYYLNPTPNDRNVEFDPKQNLLKGLASSEQVDAP